MSVRRPCAGLRHLRGRGPHDARRPARNSVDAHELLHELVAQGRAEYGAVKLADVVADVLVSLGNARAETGRFGVRREDLTENELGFLAVANGMELLEGVSALGSGEALKEELDVIEERVKGIAIAGEQVPLVDPDREGT